LIIALGLLVLLLPKLARNAKMKRGKQ